MSLGFLKKLQTFEKKSPSCFEVNVKTGGIYFSNFLAFSQCLNFKKEHLSLPDTLAMPHYLSSSRLLCV